MRSHLGRFRRWRRFSRRYRVHILVGVLALVAMALMGFITYALTSMKWRARY